MLALLKCSGHQKVEVVSDNSIFAESFHFAVGKNPIFMASSENRGTALGAIIAHGHESFSQQVSPLPTPRSALPLPRSRNHEITSAARTGPHFNSVDGSPLLLLKCVTLSLQMRHEMRWAWSDRMA